MYSFVPDALYHGTEVIMVHNNYHQKESTRLRVACQPYRKYQTLPYPEEFLRYNYKRFTPSSIYVIHNNTSLLVWSTAATKGVNVITCLGSDPAQDVTGVVGGANGKVWHVTLDTVCEIIYIINWYM